MSNPNIPQGVLNRFLGSLSFASYPNLNITSSYLGREGLSVDWPTDVTTRINTMTGVVMSPELYIEASITAHMLTSQAFGNAFMTQIQQLSILGDGTLRTDSSAFQPIQLSNISIVKIGTMSLAGNTADFPVIFGAYFPTNGSLFT